MGFEWVTEFECSVCGTSERAAGVEYDRLGYPVCPECGASTGPTAQTETGAERQPAGGPH